MRRAFFIIHQYVGFVVGVYLIVICASGATLILLENRIDGFLDYPVRHVHAGPTKQPLEVILSAVARAYPHERVTHILESCEQGCTYDATIPRGADDRIDVLIDPYTGTIVQSTVWGQSAVGILYSFHANLFDGDTGSMINSSLGLAAVLQVLTGLYLWPGWTRISRGFSIKWHADAWRLNFDLHKVTGIVCATFFVFIILTAATSVFLPEPTIAGAVSAASPDHRSPLPLDKLVARANAALPGTITMVYPPATPSSPLKIREVVPGDPDPYGWSFVSVNQYTGKVVALDDASKWPLQWKAYVYTYPLHIGSVGGYPLRYLYVVFALTPILLYYTAFLMWLNRIKRDEAVASARAARAS